ncbi:MAG: bi-domain-containing oxidoreductase [Acidobacteria bacterium]|nr:bi-domain-containing oxidoreductase [Acidobacteriota bacterium]
MKQILQNRKTGEVKVTDVPAPAAQRGRVLVRAAASLISAGTERAVVDMNRQSLLNRAMEQPELVRKTIRRARTEGLMNTVNAVRSKLDSYVALGYSAAGTVASVGEGVTEFRAGDRVACAGVGYASHAEVLSVPKNLCVRLPEAVSHDEGAYATLGAIALQGVRLAEPTLGEAVVVIGLGLLGQLAAQLLRANGCRVFGIDLDARKTELARTLGMEAGCAPDEDARRLVSEWTRGRGADAVLVTAATSSNQPIELAGEISRLKGRVVAVGGVGTDVPRDVYYRRELTLKISMSYGPGRYDPEYEERGHDYPFAYVRWTEGRNLEAFLDLVAAGSVNVERLTTHRFSVEDGERAYQLITGETAEPHLGVLLEYDTAREVERRIELAPESKASARDAKNVLNGPQTSVRVGLVGAGGYATGMLLPAFKAAGAQFQAITTASGISALNTGRQFGFAACASSAEEIINDPSVNLVVIATRNDTHATLARRALESGRHVFVEKPLALTDSELNEVLEAAGESATTLTVGFNRRFSPLARRAKEFFEGRRAPLSIVYRVNAGRLPPDHWAQNELEGGGRIVAEVCHFIDLMQFWTDALPVRVYAEAVAGRNHEIVDEDSVLITLRFADGSNGSIAYLAEGDKSLAKERAEIFGEGRSFVLDDFRSAVMYRDGREEVVKLRAQDKGQPGEVRAVCAAVLKGEPAPIPLEHLAATTRATFRIRESLRAGQALNL